MYGLRMQLLVDVDPQNFLDPRTDSGSVTCVKLRTWTDADRIPSVSLARIFLYDKLLQT